MSVESDLKKENVNVISTLDIIKVVSISNNITDLIYKNFKKYNIDKMEIFEKLSTLQMYFAKMPEGMSEASYFYKNSSIYFNDSIDKNNLEEFAIHECLHRVQEVKTANNKLIRMGLYNYSKNRNRGLAINEAVIQLMTTKILDSPPEFEKYFGISFNAVSPSYYPLICQLVNQLCFLVGEDILFESTINSNDTFKDFIIDKLNKKFYDSLVKSLDLLLDKEEDLVFITNKLMAINENDKKIEYYTKKVSTLKSEIQSIFLETQNLIISTYFDTEFNTITTLEDLNAFKNKLYKMKIYVGLADDYLFFNNYIVEKTNEIEHKKGMIESGNIETAPVIQTESKSNVFLFIDKIKKLKKQYLNKFNSNEI